MRFPLVLWLACFCFLTAEAALANAVPPVPLHEQLRRSDLVVTGRLGDRTSCTVDLIVRPCVEIVADAFIKGGPAASGIRRYLILSSDIPEMSVTPLPGNLLLFLGRVNIEHSILVDGEFYRPVHGYRSIIGLDAANLMDIQRAMCPLWRGNPSLLRTHQIVTC